MKRGVLLERLNYFDAHYNAIVHKRYKIPSVLDELDEVMHIKDDDERYKLFGEFVAKHRNVLYDTGFIRYMFANDDNDEYLQLKNRVEISDVKNITLNYNNCFTPFYDLNDEYLFLLFEAITQTHFALLNYEYFSSIYRDKKVQNRNHALQKKIDDVLAYAQEIGESSKGFEFTLQRLRGSLDNGHYTKRQAYQNLLWHIAHILSSDEKNSYKVAKAAAAIIKDYFGDDIKFTRNENIANYKETTYNYADSTGVTLHHS